MKIVLASTSILKLNACKRAFAHIAGVDVSAVRVSSGVAEQPIGDETLTGAFNRIHAARKIAPSADIYVSIESGLYEENGNYLDRAIVMVEKNCQRVTIHSDGVVFPNAAVEEARKRGFDHWTVGKIMQEQGIVSHADDPHFDLSGRSRIAYIDDALRLAVTQLGLKP